MCHLCPGHRSATRGKASKAQLPQVCTHTPAQHTHPAQRCSWRNPTPHTHTDPLRIEPGHTQTHRHTVPKKQGPNLDVQTQAQRPTHIQHTHAYVLSLCDPMDCSLPGSSVHGDSPGKNTGVGCHALLHGILPNQELNPGVQVSRILYY